MPMFTTSYWTSFRTSTATVCKWCNSLHTGEVHGPVIETIPFVDWKLISLTQLNFSLRFSGKSFMSWNNFTVAGFECATSACCNTAGRFGGLIPCGPSSKVCPDRSKYVFWDPYHPSDAANSLIAMRLIDGDSSDIFPMNVRQLTKAWLSLFKQTFYLKLWLVTWTWSGERWPERSWSVWLIISVFFYVLTIQH